MDRRIRSDIKLLTGIVKGLIVAWILTLFNLDVMFIEAIKPFVNFEFITAQWYIMFALIGAVSGIFRC